MLCDPHTSRVDQIISLLDIFEVYMSLSDVYLRVGVVSTLIIWGIYVYVYLKGRIVFECVRVCIYIYMWEMCVICIYFQLKPI